MQIHMIISLEKKGLKTVFFTMSSLYNCMGATVFVKFTDTKYNPTFMSESL
jgi:hypothetical protein